MSLSNSGDSYADDRVSLWQPTECQFVMLMERNCMEPFEMFSLKPDKNRPELTFIASEKGRRQKEKLKGGFVIS